ncbi:radical SAM/SPASM domain-containing protein [Clostridium felsineum]|uniref:radical SAM/SPASM domain-containing protein n=1 Tax=Clostridium felsineum TaxID=36839 RepID=UPI00098C3269|nr:radical SAM protein [Clostridium felsineum]URZ02533.1 PqqA peptide cyclase [Clostridium felsineum]
MGTEIETLNVYPVRANYIRVHIMNDYNIISNFRDGGSEPISNQKALIWELFTGKYDLQTIIQIFSGTFNIDFEKSRECINDVIKEYASHIKFYSHEIKTNLLCNPMRIFKKIPQKWNYSPLRYETPEELLLSLSYLCNHKCIYCCNSSGYRLKNELSISDWLKVIDEAAELGVEVINFSGGEPLMYPDFIKLVEQTKNKGMYPIISTNGTFLSEDTAKQLLELGVDFVHLSMSAANEKLYDSIVGVKGNFPKVKAAIKSLKKNNIYIRLKMVLMPNNIKYVEELLDFCDENGVDCVHLAPFILTHIARTGSELMPSLEDLEALHEVVNSKKRKIKVLEPSFESMCWSGESDIVKCGGIKTKLTVLSNGNVTLCEALGNNSNFVLGNIKATSIKNIWNSELPDNISKVNMKLVQEPCKSCEYLDGCRTGCFMSSLIYSENPYSVDPRCFKANILNNAYKGGV